MLGYKKKKKKKKKKKMVLRKSLPFIIFVLVLQPGILFYSVADKPQNSKQLATKKGTPIIVDLKPPGHPENMDSLPRYDRYESKEQESLTTDKHVTIGILAILIINTVFVFSIFFLLLIINFGKNSRERSVQTPENIVYQNTRARSVSHFPSLSRRPRRSSLDFMLNNPNIYGVQPSRHTRSMAESHIGRPDGDSL